MVWARSLSEKPRMTHLRGLGPRNRILGGGSEGGMPPPSILGGADDDVEGIDAFELDPEPPGTLPRLFEGERRDGVAARAAATTAAAAHYTGRGHADSGAHTAAHVPEAAHTDPDADGTAVAATARRLGELDRLGIEQRAVRLHDLGALEAATARVDLDSEPVGRDAVGGGDGRTRHRRFGLVGEVGRDRRHRR